MDAAYEVKQRLSIEDVVGDYIELKRAGRNLKGLCPFHSENTPSFMVNPEKGIYHCFGCGEGGDHFEFVMKMDGLDFKEALEKLAQKAGVDLSQYGSGSASLSKLKARLKQAHQLAAKYYQQSLIQNPAALSYITKTRHFNRHTIEDFQLGYAPKQGQALLNFLTKRGFSEQELEQGGLITKRQGGRYFDAFFGRVLVVLSDSQSNPIGFTGRVLDDGLPKYLNTSKTPLYDKSRHVFGLAQAKSSIRKQDLAVLVEGNFDVLASHQVNIKNVVATAGTAVTEMQLKQVAKFSGNVAFAFDQDQAGLAATMRAIPIAQKAGVYLSIIDIEGGKDPDELIQKDSRAWQKLVSKPTYVIDWLFERLSQQFDLATASGKSNFSSQLLSVLAQLTDPVEQEHYLKLLAEKTDVSLAAVQRKMSNQQTVNYSKSRSKSAAYHVGQINERKNLEENLLALLVSEKDLKNNLDVPDGVFTDERADYFSVKQLPEEDKYANILRFKAEQLYEDWTVHQKEQQAQSLIDRLQMKLKQEKMSNMTKAIRQAEERGDKQEVERLLAQYQSEL